jgi:dTDP-4-dehydrorhamnose reductase
MDTYTILIVGGTGMAGHQMYRVLRNEENFNTRATIRKDLDSLKTKGLFDAANVYEGVDFEKDGFEKFEKIVREFQPDIVVNAIGLVKQIEAPDSTFVFLNAYLPHRLYEILQTEKPGAYFVTLGTDCVFDGARGGYTENDRPDATDVYGVSKWLGEVTDTNALTLRTSIYGPEIENTAHGVLAWFLSAPREVKGFTEAYFSGVSTRHLAELIAGLLKTDKRPTGLYHLHSDRISKHDLIQLFNKHFKTEKTIVPDSVLHIDRSLRSVREPLFTVASHDEMVRALAEASA